MFRNVANNHLVHRHLGTSCLRLCTRCHASAIGWFATLTQPNASHSCARHYVPHTGLEMLVLRTHMSRWHMQWFVLRTHALHHGLGSGATDCAAHNPGTNPCCFGTTCLAIPDIPSLFQCSFICRALPAKRKKQRKSSVYHGCYASSYGMFGLRPHMYTCSHYMLTCM